MEKKETTILGPGPNRVEVPESWTANFANRSLCYTPRQWIDLDKQFEPPNSGKAHYRSLSQFHTWHIAACLTTLLKPKKESCEPTVRRT
jgi:hypothetical protein